MEFTRAAHVVAGILFHSSTMTSRSCWMLDTWCFSTFRLRMPQICSIGFRYGDTLGQSITFIFSSKAVVILGYVGKQFLKGGIICFRMSQYMLESMFPLNESQLLSTSSRHAAPDYDATTTMLDCRQGTTCWTLIRPQDMVPVIHALGQVVFFDNNGCMLSYFQRTVIIYCYWECNGMNISYHDYSGQNYHGYQYYHGIVNMLEMFKKYWHINHFKFYIKKINKQWLPMILNDNLTNNSLIAFSNISFK